jgi:hypothetical protein
MALDGKAHYIALNAKVELEQYPVGSVVEARGSRRVRARPTRTSPRSRSMACTAPTIT